MHANVGTKEQASHIPMRDILAASREVDRILGGPASYTWWPERRFDSQTGACVIPFTERTKEALAAGAIIQVPGHGVGWSVSFTDIYGDIIEFNMDLTEEQVYKKMCQYTGIESHDQEHWSDWMPLIAVGVLIVCLVLSAL